MLNFPDLSNHQRGLQLGAIPHDAVIFKATEGVGYTDPSFDTNAAQSAGQLRAVYHFARPDLGNSAQAEADWFCDSIAPHIDGLTIPVLDWEPPNPADTGWASAFVQRVHERTGILPWFYANLSSALAYDWSAVAKDCGLWLAWYPNTLQRGYGDRPDTPAVPGWTLAAHQFTAWGRLPGWGGDLDLNIGFLDEAAWRAYAAGDGGVVASMPEVNIVQRWAEQAPGTWMDNNESGVADCTDVPKNLHEFCTGTSWESANMYGHGTSLAGNCSRELYDVQPFSTEVDYPTGTIFSTDVPGSIYGHTGVLSHVVAGIWWAFQQDTGKNTPCELRPLEFTPHTVAIPRYAGKMVHPAAVAPQQVSGFTIWTVDPGDTLSAIAAVNGTTVQRLLALNPEITNPDVIQVGQVIKLVGDAAPVTPVRQDGGFTIWTVDPGDTLSGIAAANGTTVEQLLALNPDITDPNMIQVGQVIKLTGDAPQAAPATSGGFTFWIVDPGDTLSGIAEANGTTVQRLLALNPDITNPDAIYVGQRINLV